MLPFAGANYTVLSLSLAFSSFSIFQPCSIEMSEIAKKVSSYF